MSRVTFQSLILRLQNFWAERGCIIETPLDLEVGAGTMHPATFLRVLGPEPWNVAYVQPSRRPADGRYGDNPFRLGKHYQFQVILKPSPLNVQELYLDSLRALGLDLSRHDIRFEEDNWESPTLGAWGVGWQILLDGMEITQFTYFQQAGGIDLAPMSAEITYGLERLTMFLARQSSVFDIDWVGGVPYGAVRKQDEYEFSKYYFETADVDVHWKLFEVYEAEARRCLDAKLVLPAYDWTLKCSHVFNTLDARGAVSVTERVGVIKRVRDLAVRCAEQYLEARKELGFPPLHRNVMAEYFFELLTEEIPAWMLPHPQLEARLRELAPTLTINYSPRRIAFVLRELPDKRDDQVQEVKGPPKQAAYKDGAPTPALHGFLKKRNAKLEDLIDKDDPYVWIRETLPGRATRDVLAEAIPQVIEGLRWPKMMRWGTGEHSYIRPIHSVISLFDGEHLPISIFGTQSGTRTVGHRTLAPKAFEVGSYNDYVTKLELARVYVDADRRKHAMAAAAIALAKEVGGKPADDASIWSQWQYLTEYPGLVRAEFRRDFLALPEEVLVTVMRVHQKQLPIRDRDDRLTSSFLAVLDNEGDPDGNAAYGNSFVTNARFADAQFFYETDRRRKLEDRLEQLAHLQFQEKLGNYRDKTARIERIARGILDDADVALAARLCKTDLVTEMVKEFTDLQGRVGGIYAREEGLPENVWQAIYDHYQPVSLDDALPRNITGAVVSLADRIDTLVGFFSIGARPTGSKDPFGLRRAAQGVVQILLNRDKREVKIGVDRLIDLGMEAYGGAAAASAAGAPRRPGAAAAPQETLREDLLAFFTERVRTILEASAWQFAYDEIAAAMEAGWASSLTDLVDRIAAVKAIRNEADFLSLLDSAKRIANITAGHESTEVDPAKFEHPIEGQLLDHLAMLELDDKIAQRDYRGALAAFASLAPALEQFFKDVMVNVEDEAVRRNRMSLLRRVGGAAMKIADVTKIVVDRRDYRA